MNNLKPDWIEVTTNDGDKFILDPIIESGRVKRAKESGLTVRPLYYSSRACQEAAQCERMYPLPTMPIRATEGPIEKAPRAWVGLSDAAKLHFVKHCEGWSAIKIIEVVENELREINNG